MYHDQGQIALKLLGFESGVTVLGRLPDPDRDAGARHGLRHRRPGIADPSATIKAFETVLAMSANKRAKAAA